MRDYESLSSEFTFTPKVMVGDSQCTAVGIIDNNLPDGFRQFNVSLLSLDPRIQVDTLRDQIVVGIIDDDCKFVYTSTKTCTQIDD